MNNMKSITSLYKYINEASILDIENTIKIGDSIEEHSNLIALWKKHYINFNVFIKERFMKDAKSYKRKTGTQYIYGIEGFDYKKKYFFIVKESANYDTDHSLAKQYPKLTKFTYKLYINDDGGNIGGKMLTDNGRGNIDIDISYYHKNGKYYPINNYKTPVGNFMFDYGDKKAEVYEVPKQYELLYDYIKERKLL